MHVASPHVAVNERLAGTTSMRARGPVSMEQVDKAFTSSGLELIEAKGEYDVN